jgi:hypothetical protein
MMVIALAASVVDAITLNQGSDDEWFCDEWFYWTGTHQRQCVGPCGVGHPGKDTAQNGANHGHGVCGHGVVPYDQAGAGDPQIWCKSEDCREVNIEAATRTLSGDEEYCVNCYAIVKCYQGYDKKFIESCKAECKNRNRATKIMWQQDYYMIKHFEEKKQACEDSLSDEGL